MDTSHYYITCHGEERGPYRFYQLQQLRTNDMLVEEQFEPEEWQQLVHFLETGEIPKRGPGGLKKIYIHKEGEKTQERKRPLLVCLTYIGYLIGGGFFIGGLLQGGEDFILRAEPMFVAGLIFCVALCYTIVNATLRSHLSRVSHPGKGALFVVYLAGLVPAVALTALTATFAEVFLKNSAVSVWQIIETGMIYLAAGALVCVYLPFYFHATLAESHSAPRKPHSVAWMTAPVFLAALCLLYFSPEQLLGNPKVAELRGRLFSEEQMTTKSRLPWQFPIKLGDKAKKVERILGKPEKIVASDYVYDSGLRIFFDARNRVLRLHLRAGGDAAEFAQQRVIANITLQMTVEQMAASLQMSATALFDDALTETSVWEDGVYRIAACFWKAGSGTGRLQEKGSLKWIEISRAQ